LLVNGKWEMGNGKWEMVDGAWKPAGSAHEVSPYSDVPGWNMTDKT
jgi:hypothetical protein